MHRRRLVHSHCKVTNYLSLEKWPSPRKSELTYDSTSESCSLIAHEVIAPETLHLGLLNVLNYTSNCQATFHQQRTKACYRLVMFHGRRLTSSPAFLAPLPRPIPCYPPTTACRFFINSRVPFCQAYTSAQSQVCDAFNTPARFKQTRRLRLRSTIDIGHKKQRTSNIAYLSCGGGQELNDVDDESTALKLTFLPELKHYSSSVSV